MSTSQDRLAGLPAGAALFAYGTLQFTEILGVLLGRLPEHRPGAAPGWRAAALAGRVYPGLVRADATVTGKAHHRADRRGAADHRRVRVRAL